MRVSGVQPNYGQKQVSFGTVEEAKIVKNMIEEGLSDLRVASKVNRSNITPKEAKMHLRDSFMTKINETDGSEQKFWESLWKKLSKEK